jgi:hypothetical protein
MLSHIAHYTAGCLVHCRLSVYVAFKRINAPPRNGSSNFAVSTQPIIKYTISHLKNIPVLCIQTLRKMMFRELASLSGLLGVFKVK